MRCEICLLKWWTRRRSLCWAQGFLVKGKENKVYRQLYMDSNKRHEHGTVRLTPTSVTKNWRVVNRLCMLRRKVKSKWFTNSVLCLYVDDLIYTWSSLEMIDNGNNAMMLDFQMKNWGLIPFFLGIEVRQSEDGILITQEKYAEDLLKRFKMLNCKQVATPMNPSDKIEKHDNAEKVDPSI